LPWRYRVNRRVLATAIAAAAAVAITAVVVTTQQASGPVLTQRGGPPWPRPADTAAGVHLAGLAMSRSAGEITRYYLHLDVVVNGKPVPVPANLGADPGDGATSALRSWDSSGIIGVQSNAESPSYTLRQLFDIWQVPLSATQIGGLRSGGRRSLAVYVNGQKARGDPGSITLAPQQEIAIEFGAGPFSPPASYQFPPAE
jgi:hypothetical protein